MELSSPSPGSESPRAAPSLPEQRAPHDRRAVFGFLLILAILLVTLAASFVKGQDIFIFGYIMAIVYIVGGPRRHGRPWADLGIKRGFRQDFRRVWYLVGVDAVLFQLLPPMLGVAYLLGFYPELLQTISGRLSVSFGSLEGLTAVASLLAAALVLTLFEELVFRVTVQERLSWFLGTPAAIVLASLLFGVTHAVGATGTAPAILLDVAGVTLDGLFFGLIYARTHNLAVTWATHYAADVVGLLALAFIF